MRKFLITTIFLLATSGAALASDCVWPYVGVIAGVSAGADSTLKLGNGFQFAGLAGAEFCKARVEAEIGYRKSDVDSVRGVPAGGTINLVSYMVNGYYEFDVKSKIIRPYVGGGAGLATADLSSGYSVGGVPAAGGTSTKFAYQGIGGVGFFVTPHFVLDTSYRYFSTLKYDIGALDAPYSTHNIVIGGRWRF